MAFFDTIRKIVNAGNKFVRSVLIVGTAVAVQAGLFLIWDGMKGMLRIKSANSYAMQLLPYIRSIGPFVSLYAKPMMLIFGAMAFLPVLHAIFNGNSGIQAVDKRANPAHPANSANQENQATPADPAPAATKPNPIKATFDTVGSWATFALLAIGMFFGFSLGSLVLTWGLSALYYSEIGQSASELVFNKLFPDVDEPGAVAQQSASVDQVPPYAEVMGPAPAPAAAAQSAAPEGAPIVNALDSERQRQRDERARAAEARYTGQRPTA